MLRTASQIHGYSIAATDGHLGTVSDFLFEDGSWSIRWLVVDTGKWLSGRKVLLPTSVLADIDPGEQDFTISLTKQQVKDSPDLGSDQPVSRQMEANVYDHYGWDPYWMSDFYVGGMGGMGGYGLMGSTMADSPSLRARRHAIDDARARQHEGGDPHLRSTQAVTGYHIHATDGEIGHVKDFLVNDANWSIHYLIVDTTNWWAGNKVLISPRSVQQIDWEQKLVHLDVDRQKVKDSPTYDASVSVDPAYETQFRTYYGQNPPDDRA